MLLQLLTLLLPIRASESEVVFHHDHVLHTYRAYHRRLEATGYRDRDTLRKLEKETTYSMSVLKTHMPRFWWHICQYRNRAWGLKSVTPLEKVPELVPEP